MATRANEVEVLAEGIQANAPSKGSFALNMLYESNSWRVRDGFGTVTQFDTTMSCPLGSGIGTEWGYKKHLGSRLIKTNFGNLQMLSVFMSTVNTSLVETSSELMDVYLISIYDLDTNERFEVPLYPHTSQSAVSHSYPDIVPSSSPQSVATGPRSYMTFQGDNGWGLQFQTPQYQTDAEASHSSWIKARDEFFFFEEFNDILFFGNKYAGTWAYIPASFNKTRPVVLDRVNKHEAAGSYGESSMITPVVLCPGVNIESFDYLRTADLTQPVDVAVVQNRLVYASGKALYWSDPGFPASITANNLFLVPSEEDITAVAELNSNLVVFTENETWLYQPSVGDIVSAGRLTRTSDTVGCVGPNSLCKVEGSLVWVDTSGVYSTTNGLDVRGMSEEIQPFFRSEGIGNPLNAFFVGSGQGIPYRSHGGFTESITGPDIDHAQPMTTLRFEPDGVSCAYSAERGLLLISIPGLSGALALTRGKWAWWTFESMVRTEEYLGAHYPAIAAMQNLPAPWVLSYQNDMFAIAGPDVQDITDSAKYADGSAVNRSSTFRSFFIMEYGRGGSIDRSISHEDDRELGARGVRHYVAVGGETNYSEGGVYLGDPIPVPDGYVFSEGPTAADGRFYLVPVTIVLADSVLSPWFPDPTAALGGATAKGVKGLDIKLGFDGTHWQPVKKTASSGNGTVVEIVPTERLAGDTWFSNWFVTQYATSFAGGNQSDTGSLLWIKFDGSIGTTGFTFNPNLNLSQGRHNRLLYIPMERVSAKANESTSTMGFAPGVASGFVYTTNNDGAAVGYHPLHVFERWSNGSDYVRKDDSVAQPVDWAYKSTNVGLNEGNELKMRGTYVSMLSHGTGEESLNSNWPYGVFNTLIGSDRKEWSAQIVDMVPDYPAVDGVGITDTSIGAGGTAFVFPTLKSTITTRVQKSTSSTLVEKTFNTTGVNWEGAPNTTPDNSNRGTLIIGDEEVSEIAVSTSVKGQTFSVMHFGFILNRAEKIAIEAIKAVFRVGGGRRRRGR